MRKQFLQSPGLSTFGRRRGNAPSTYAVNGIEPTLVADFTSDVYQGSISQFSDFTTSGTSFETVAGVGGLRVNSGAGATLSLPAAKVPSYTDAFCVVMKGKMTYTDDNTVSQIVFYDRVTGSMYLRARLRTDSTKTGMLFAQQNDGANYDWRVSSDAYSPGTDVNFSVAVRHGASFLQCAADGVAGAEDTTPTSLADLSTEQLKFATTGNLFIEQILIFSEDIGTTGIEEASSNGPFDVFALFGQSNMMGVASYDGNGEHPGRVYQWTQGDVLVEATPPLSHPGFVVGSMGADIAFSEDYTAADKARKILFVPCAVSGSGFSDNNWNQGDPSYAAAVAQLNEVLASNRETELKGILWIQGETDAKSGNEMSQAQYAATVDAMISAMRADITGGADVPFVLGQIGPYLDTGTYPTRDAVNAAIADTPNRVANTAFASSAGLTDLGDGVHYDAASLRTMGSRLFNAWASI